MRGTVLLKATGRPSHVLGKPCAEWLLEHEVYVTEAEQAVGPFRRGVKVGKAVPDGLFEWEGVRFAVEVDNSTMSMKLMRQKWDNYAGFDGMILVVCHTKGRLRRLMRGAGPVKERALFTLFRWLAKGRRPWIDWKFKRTATPERAGRVT